MLVKNRNLFRISRFLIFSLPHIFRQIARSSTRRKRLLIVKTEAIGDYILFRNFIEVVKRSTRFRDYEIHLLGNSLWQQLATHYDAPFVSSFMFIDCDSLYEAPLKLLRLADRLFRNNYEFVLHPTSSRTLIADGICAFTAAKHVIGFESDTERIRADYKRKTDKSYTQLIRLPPHLFFEFDRSKFFFETVLGESNFISGPELSPGPNKTGNIVIFPGSGVSKRNWQPDNFLALSQNILQNTDQTICLAGGEKEIALCDYLEQKLSSARVINLAGKTSLLQLVELISCAGLLISNDTGAVHIAAAVKTKTVCILGGGHFNRFLPYSNAATVDQACVYERMDCYNCNWNCKFITNACEPYPCIANLSVQKVWEETLPMLGE